MAIWHIKQQVESQGYYTGDDAETSKPLMHKDKRFALPMTFDEAETMVAAMRAELYSVVMVSSGGMEI